MRELMIRFVDDGEVFNEIDEKRNYYLSEAEVVLEKIRVRLTNEKRVVSPKEFECWIDGVRLIISSVRFENDQSLEEQLKETIMSYEGWKEGTKHKYINKINEYVAKERELMAHQQFKAFAIRYDQYMGNISAFELDSLLLNMDQMKKLFDEILINVSTGFYSELERIMDSIYVATQTVVSRIHNELLELDENEYEGSLVDFLNVRVITWLGNDENFRLFKNYVVAFYNSVTKIRIHALYPKYEPYQKLQLMLFKDIARKHGFDYAYQLNKELFQSFNEKYDNILFEGFALKTDDMVESLVLSPVIKKYSEIVQGKLNEEPKEDENKRELQDDNEGMMNYEESYEQE